MQKAGKESAKASFPAFLIHRKYLATIKWEKGEIK